MKTSINVNDIFAVHDVILSTLTLVSFRIVYLQAFVFPRPNESLNLTYNIDHHTMLVCLSQCTYFLALSDVLMANAKKENTLK